MLFSIKKNVSLTLLATLVITTLSLYMQSIFGLEWDFELNLKVVLIGALGFILITFSDFLIHITLIGILRSSYLDTYTRFIYYFRSQSVYTVLVSGLAAGSEELFFRGVVLEGLVQIAGASELWALATSALFFGAFHLIFKRGFALFGLWAVWEGVLLGGLYLYSGSLLLCVVVHCLHDILGYSFYAFQRHTGFLL